ncbi:MAG: metal ABC transporter ATP-binding protein [Nitrospirota bacterium]
MDAIIEIADVAAGYGHKPIFYDLSLKILEGQFAGIVGPTGSGKTTVLRTILGTIKPLTGHVTIMGRPVETTPAGTIGYVPQLETVDWNFPVTVEQVVLMGLCHKGGIWPWPSKKDRIKVREIMERLGIGECTYHHIRNISGGQQQRAFLARALVSNPKILVLDEPTAGIDIKTQHDVLHLLGELNSDGVTILLTTHDLNAVAAHLPWVICFNHGLIAKGKPKDIFNNDVLRKTYGAEIMIVQHGEHLLISPSTPLSL